MKSFNQVQLIGSITKPPKIYALPSGRLVARFTLDTQYRHKLKPDEQPVIETHRHALITYGKLAELAERLLQTGIWVFVCGRLQTRSYEDSAAGLQVSTEIIVHDLIVLNAPLSETVLTQSTMTARLKPPMDLSAESIQQAHHAVIQSLYEDDPDSARH